MVKRQRSTCLISVGEKEKSTLSSGECSFRGIPERSLWPCILQCSCNSWNLWNPLGCIHSTWHIQALKFCLYLPPLGPWLWQIPGEKVSGAHPSFAVRHHSSCEAWLGCLLTKGKKFRQRRFYRAGNKGHQSKEKKENGELEEGQLWITCWHRKWQARPEWTSLSLASSTMRLGNKHLILTTIINSCPKFFVNHYICG